MCAFTSEAAAAAAAVHKMMKKQWKWKWNCCTLAHVKNLPPFPPPHVCGTCALLVIEALLLLLPLTHSLVLSSTLIIVNFHAIFN